MAVFKRKPCVLCSRAPPTGKLTGKWFYSSCCLNQYCPPCLNKFYKNLTAARCIGLGSICPSGNLATFEHKVNPVAVKSVFGKWKAKRVLARIEELKNSPGLACAGCGDVVLKIERSDMTKAVCLKKGVKICEMGLVTMAQGPVSEKGFASIMEVVGSLDMAAAICNKNGSDLVVCTKCATKTCTICKKEAHINSDCPKDKELRQLLTLAVKNKWLRCGGCHILFEKPTSSCTNNLNTWVRCTACTSTCCTTCGVQGFPTGNLGRFISNCRCNSFFTSKLLKVKRFLTPTKFLAEKMVVKGAAA